jgi:hypothetical protein
MTDVAFQDNIPERPSMKNQEQPPTNTENESNKKNKKENKQKQNN